MFKVQSSCAKMSHNSMTFSLKMLRLVFQNIMNDSYKALTLETTSINVK